MQCTHRACSACHSSWSDGVHANGCIIIMTDNPGLKVMMCSNPYGCIIWMHHGNLMCNTRLKESSFAASKDSAALWLCYSGIHWLFGNTTLSVTAVFMFDGLHAHACRTVQDSDELPGCHLAAQGLRRQSLLLQGLITRLAAHWKAPHMKRFYGVAVAVACFTCKQAVRSTVTVIKRLVTFQTTFAKGRFPWQDGGRHTVC
jgi:hypothetical protein